MITRTRLESASGRSRSTRQKRAFSAVNVRLNDKHERNGDMKRVTPLCSTFPAAAVLVFVAVATAAEPRVELEVVTEQGFVGTDARAWSEMLTQAGFSSVRIKSGGKDSPSLQTSGTPAAPSY